MLSIFEAKTTHKNVDHLMTNTNQTPAIRSKTYPFGIGLGIALSLVSLLLYFFYLEGFAQWWYRGVNLFLILIVGVLAILQAKKQLTTSFTFRLAFTAFFIPVAIGTGIATLFSYVLFDIADIEAAQYISERAVEITKQMMENQGASEEQLKNTITNMQSENQFSFKNQAIGYGTNLIFYTITGLIISLFFKEKTFYNA